MILSFSRKVIPFGIVCLLASILFGCEQPSMLTPTPVRVISFNIRYDNPDDGEHNWQHRKEHVASTILFNDAQLIGVQEALKHQLDELSILLPGYQWTGVGRDDGMAAGEYTAVFYDTSRFDLLGSETFWLSESPEIPGSKSWDAAITRIATIGHFKDQLSDQDFYFANTHFDHIGEVARTESARLLVERLPSLAGEYPLVLTGDFNFTDDKEGYAIITEQFRDARDHAQLAPHGPEATIYGGFEVTHEPGRRIDYIFVSDQWKVMKFATLSDNWDGAFASDHLAVLAELGL